MDKNTILTYLKNHKTELSNNYNISKIALFGSYTKDIQTKDSDIDILVEMPSSFKNFFKLKYHLESEFNKKVDLSTFDNVRSFIRHKIEKDLIYV